MSRNPRLWFDRLAVWPALCWVAAISITALALLTWPLNDDEVFYLARSWAVAHGEPSNGDLPLRYLLMLPYVWAHLAPSATVWVSRLSMVLAALLCGVLVRSTVKRLDPAGKTASVAGAFTVIGMMGLPMVTLRPEYFACLFGLLGMTLFLAPPNRMSRHLSAFLAGLCIGLAVSISIRQIWLVPAALLAGLVEPDRGSRGRILKWTLAGLTVAGVPSIAYLLTHDSIESVRYWNTIFPIRAGWAIPTPTIVKVYLVGLPLVGLALAWRGNPVRHGIKMIALFWICAGVSYAVMPLRVVYAQGMWLAAGIVLCAAGPYRSARRKQDAKRRARSSAAADSTPQSHQLGAYIALFVAMTAIPPLVPSLRPWMPSPDPLTSFRELNSQVRLLDWLADTSRGGPVVCVAPYHPIRASNAWRMWNAWWYCFIGDEEINRTVNGDFERTLTSGNATIMEWNTWMGHTAQTQNLLRYALATRVVTPAHAPDVARRVVERYRLVEWKEPLPPAFGGGAFLVRRDIDLDSRVAVLPDSIVLFSIYRR